MFATTKVEGTDNVYIFRYQNHQAMFVVTPAGVIVTDPISYGRPQAAKTYLDEIRKITQGADQIPDLQPPSLRSHRRRQSCSRMPAPPSIAHRRAKERLAAAQGPGRRHSRSRWWTASARSSSAARRLDLVFTGRNHSDSSLVLLLPKEKILFAVDFNSLGAVPSRLAVNDSYPTEWEASLEAHAGAWLGAHDPGPSWTGWAAWHQAKTWKSRLPS